MTLRPTYYGVIAAVHAQTSPPRVLQAAPRRAPRCRERGRGATAAEEKGVTQERGEPNGSSITS